MKNTLITLLCLLCALVLTAGAVCIGARNGWIQEREEALGVSSQTASSLEERAMDAANLYVVASRHLPKDDPLMVDLLGARTLLQSQTATSAEKAQADVSLTATAQVLSETLPGLDSVKASARDQVYIATLTRTLVQGRDAVAFTLNAQDFNNRLASSLTGRLAMLLGVDPIEISMIQ